MKTRLIAELLRAFFFHEIGVAESKRDLYALYAS